MCSKIQQWAGLHYENEKEMERVSQLWPAQHYIGLGRSDIVWRPPSKEYIPSFTCNSYTIVTSQKGKSFYKFILFLYFRVGIYSIARIFGNKRHGNKILMY